MLGTRVRTHGEPGASPVGPRLAAFSYTHPVNARRSGVLSTLLLAGVLVSCTDGSNSAPTTLDSQPASTAVRVDDGILTVGAVLPTVGPSAELGVSMSAALAVAAQEINDAGGVNGRRIRLVLREEGDSPASALLAVQNLLQADVDAIIGPTSSLTLLNTLAATVEAGLLTCAPTASALALDDFPDDGLLFRTIPSDSLQAQALARLIETSGAGSAAIVAIDDGYGRAFADQVATAIRRNGTEVVAQTVFDDSELSLREAAQAVADADPDVVTVIADGLSGPAIIAAIDDATGQRLTFVINDAGRRPDAAAPPYTGDLAARVIGASPVAYPTSTAFADALAIVDPSATGLYAQNAYDCLNIIALAAASAESTDPTEIADLIAAVTASGSSCSTFPACITALDAGRNINYDGPSGYLSVNATGEAVGAVFERFTFDENGNDVGDGLLRIGDA